MKNKKWRLLLFRAFILSINLCCNKDKLTKATQTGANTFSCKIDGVVFKSSESAGLFGSPPVTVYNYPGDFFTLLGKYYGDRSDPISTYISLSLTHLENTGTYKLNVYPNQSVYVIDYSGGPVYQTDSTHTGIVNITRCDNLNSIYSGTFSFSAIDKNTGKVIKVTDGRFDAKQ